MYYRSSQQGFVRQALLAIVLGVGVCFVGIKLFILPPQDFPKGYTFTIVKGDTLSSVAFRLQQDRLVASPEAFKMFLVVLGNEHRLSEGNYYFEAPITSIEVALKIAGNEFDLVQHRVTFPEGFTNEEIAQRLEKQFPQFDGQTFRLRTKTLQGRLFPDTYGFSAAPSVDEVLTAFEKNFEEKVAPLREEMQAQKKSEEDILTMASLLEKEANTGQEASVVGGILWKRIARGIPLQVDAPFLFLFGKTSAELTRQDLAVDSPFNTYRYKGLPPSPINNPGLAAIEAALRPIDSPYLYYLHDAEGRIHYAKDYAGHLENKKKYLQ